MIMKNIELHVADQSIFLSTTTNEDTGLVVAAGSAYADGMSMKPSADTCQSGTDEESVIGLAIVDLLRQVRALRVSEVEC